MNADLPEPDPVIDNGSPNFITGLRTAAALADRLKIPLEFGLYHSLSRIISGQKVAAQGQKSS